jgi:hypothetical protein
MILETEKGLTEASPLDREPFTSFDASTLRSGYPIGNLWILACVLAPQSLSDTTPSLLYSRWNTQVLKS